MSTHHIGAVEVSLIPQPDKKPLHDTSLGKVELACKNYSVLPMDIRLRDLHAVDVRIAEASAAQRLPMMLNVGGRVSRSNARVPFVQNFSIGNWKVKTESGETDVKAEVDGQQGGVLVSGSYGWVADEVYVKP